LGLLKALERIVELMDAERLDAAPFLTPELDVRPDGSTREPPVREASAGS